MVDQIIVGILWGFLKFGSRHLILALTFSTGRSMISEWHHRIQHRQLYNCLEGMEIKLWWPRSWFAYPEDFENSAVSPNSAVSTGSSVKRLSLPNLASHSSSKDYCDITSIGGISSVIEGQLRSSSSLGSLKLEQIFHGWSQKQRDLSARGGVVAQNFWPEMGPTPRPKIRQQQRQHRS